MVTTKVTTKGQIVIPSKIRYRHGIKRGTKLYIEERGGELILKPITPEYFKKISGVLNKKGKGLKALIKEKAREKKL